MKKRGLLIIVTLLAFILFVACGGQSQEDQMRAQLEGLDSESFTEIQNWMDNELQEFEDVELSLWSIDDEDELIREGVLEDEERFIYFRFNVGELEEGGTLLFVEFVFETVDLGELIREELDQLDTTSFSDITEWIESATERFDDTLLIHYQSIDKDGDRISSDIIDKEELFVEWKFEIDDSLGFIVNVDIQLVYSRRIIFQLGDTFQLDDLEVTVGTEIVWGQVDNPHSSDHGEEFFKVPVRVENISNSTNNSFLARKYGPDGRSLDVILIPRVDDDITFMGGLQPGAYQEGYMYFRFVGDGDYTAEFITRPFEIVLNIPIDAYAMRGAAPGAPAEANIQDLVDTLQDEIHYIEEDFGGMMELSIELVGDYEIVFIYTILESVPASEIPEFQEIMEEFLDLFEISMLFTMFYAKAELGLDVIVLTTVFEDIDGTELLRRSFEF